MHNISKDRTYNLQFVVCYEYVTCDSTVYVICVLLIWCGLLNWNVNK